jgi:cytoskeleton protein RodZ
VRVGRKVTLEEASTATHIRPLYLGALESGDWSALPGMAYGRGYLKRYAEFLGLDATKMLETSTRLQGKITARLNYLDIVSTEETPSPALLWLSLAVALALSIGWAVWRYSDIEAASQDYTLPSEIAALLEKRSTVTSSPYPPAAQECMKLLQPPRDPCYWATQATPVYPLAYHPITRLPYHP